MESTKSDWDSDPLIDQRPTFKIPKNGPILDREGNPISESFHSYKKMVVTDSAGMKRHILLGRSGSVYSILVFRKGRFEQAQFPNAFGDQLHHLEERIASYDKEIAEKRAALKTLLEIENPRQVEKNEISGLRIYISTLVSHQVRYLQLMSKERKRRAQGGSWGNSAMEIYIEHIKTEKGYKRVVMGKTGAESGVITEDIDQVTIEVNLK